MPASHPQSAAGSAARRSAPVAMAGPHAPLTIALVVAATVVAAAVVVGPAVVLPPAAVVVAATVVVLPEDTLWFVAAAPVARRSRVMLRRDAIG